MAEISLICRGVVKSFGALKALAGVSFIIEGPIIKGLIGPNGSGKTVLLNVISKVPYGPDEGVILFNGMRIDKLTPQQICRLGIARTFQTTTFFPSLTVEQNLLVGATSIGVGKEIIDKALNITNLHTKRDIKAANLSIFELKKLMLAAALAIDPKLLLLDEPLSGLSEDEIDEMLKIIQYINATGKALLVIEHKISELAEICKELLVLHLGQVIADGPPEEVINSAEVFSAYFGGEKEIVRYK
jgi:branched-chain amino acid transport system ATP-binding protein